MERRIVSGIVIVLLLTGISSLTFDVKPESGTFSSHNDEQVKDTTKSLESSSSSATTRFDQQTYTFITERGIGIGHRFNTTIELYDVTELFAWQVRVYFNNTILNSTNAYYHPEDPIHTVNHATVSPVIVNDFNETHGYVQFGVSAIYPDHVNVTTQDYPLGLGICILEFEVVMKPSGGKRLESRLVLHDPHTYLLWKDGATEIPCTKKNGLYYLISANIRVPIDYATIQEAINAAETGHTIFVYNGTYYENVIINKTIILAGQSLGTTIINGSLGTVLYIEASDASIDGFTLCSGNYGVYLETGSHGATISSCLITENNYGIYVYDIASITIQNNNIVANTNNGIRVYRTTYSYAGSSLLIFDNKIAENSGHGVHIYQPYGNVRIGMSIYANNITTNGGDGIYVNLHSAHGDSNSGSWLIYANDVIKNTGSGINIKVFDTMMCHSWRICANNITGNNKHGIYEKVGAYVWARSWLIRNNIIFRNGEAGISIDGPDHWSWNRGLHDWEISENNVTLNKYGFHLSGENNILRNNRINNNTYNFGVSGIGKHDVDTSNTVNGKPIHFWMNKLLGEVPADAGYIALVDSANIVVRNLNLSHNEQGILLIRTSNITLEDFHPSNNVYGMYIQESSNSTLHDIDLVNNTYGIYLHDCSSLLIDGSSIANNSYGIFLSASVNSTIWANDITQNTRGIHISGSSDNNIYHNNFIKNNQQVVVSGTVANAWNLSYPSGGNYWSDYTGPDECKGVYQNETGNDGIVDTSYVIDQDNIDNHPLSAPWSSPINIIMPGNTTYRGTNITLTFTVDFSTSWMGYSLDDNANVTTTENITLTDLSYSSHHIIIFANDTSGNMYSSAKVYFTITFLTDLNYDKEVETRDLAMTCYAQGSYPRDSRWKVVTDVNKDGTVDILDIALVAADYGETWH